MERTFFLPGLILWLGTSWLSAQESRALNPSPTGEKAQAGLYMAVDLATGRVIRADACPKDLLTDTSGPGHASKWMTRYLLLRKIPAGTFVMGSPEDEPGREANERQHKVTLSQDFYIGVFEVTVGQYAKIMGKRSGEDPRWPANLVCWSWDVRGGKWPGGEPSAETFCGKLSAKTGMPFDLPTEAQWEYACRAGTKTALNNGKDLAQLVDNDPALSEVAWCGAGSPHAVGGKAPNAWGLYDMHGNCWEWVLDNFAEYPNGDVTDPVGPAGEGQRIMRGGAWKPGAGYTRSAFRTAVPPGDRSHGAHGFRVIMRIPAGGK